METFTTRAPLAWITPELIEVVSQGLIKAGFVKQVSDASDDILVFHNDRTQTFLCPTFFRDWKFRLIESVDVLAFELGVTPIEWLLSNMKRGKNHPLCEVTHF